MSPGPTKKGNPNKVKKKVSKPKAPEQKVSKEVKKFEALVEKVCCETEVSYEYPVQYSSPANCLHSGSFVLDLFMSGGYRKGRMHTHSGPPRVGKSTFLQESLWAGQQQRALIYHFDVEMSATRNYMHKQNIKLGDAYRLSDGRKGYYYFRPRTGESCYRAALRLLNMLPESRDPNTRPNVLLLIDSYKAMRSEAVDDESSPLANEARMHNRFQGMLRDSVERAGATLVATNQIRVRGIGSFVAYEDEAAGNAILHFADARIGFSRKKPGSAQKGWGTCPSVVSPVKIKIKKCRMADSEGMEGDLRLVQGRGFDRLHDRLSFLGLVGHIKKEGNKWIVEGKELKYHYARKLMKEKPWKKLCVELRNNPKTYETFFNNPKDKLKHEEW